MPNDWWDPKPENLIGVKNDSGLDPQQVIDMLKDGVTIDWGTMGVRITRSVLEEARRDVRGLTQDQRILAMSLLECKLNASMKRMKRGSISNKTMNRTMQDLVLWHALKELQS